jgi:hypothetical protein
MFLADRSIKDNLKKEEIVLRKTILVYLISKVTNLNSSLLYLI